MAVMKAGMSPLYLVYFTLLSSIANKLLKNVSMPIPTITAVKE